MNLKKYLLSNFHDDKYIGRSLIYIYLHDRKHYKELLRKAAIASDAHNFLSSYRQQLEDAESISTDAFRLLKYENLIDEFTKVKEIKEKPIKDGDNAKPNLKPHNTMKAFEDEHKDIYIDLLCSRDKTKMHVTKFAKFKRNGDKKIITFPIYECPTCGKLYTTLSIYPNNHKISVSGKIYTNLTSKFNRTDHVNHNLLKERHLVKANFFIHDQKAIKCINKDCKNHELQTIPIVLKTKKGKKTIQKVKWCNKCNAYYFPISQLDFYDFPYDIINKTELPEIEAQYIKRTNENSERKRIQEENKRLAAELSSKKLEARIKNQAAIQEALIKKQDNAVPYNPKADMAIIDAKDFLVRRSVFKCMHDDHKITDIIAAVTIIDKKGNERTAKISAGYCAACNVYFIMESTYDNLKRQGIPLCRVSDEKNYLKSSINVNGMRLANESILMQYGYNVSQEEDLSETTRHKILATLIDKHIMSKSEIISYLDFFISQRQSQGRYHMAIGKWELDRSFVENYKKGKYQEIGVLGLHY